MQSDDAAEPIEWDLQKLKRSLDEWEGIASQMIERLPDTVDCEGSQNWQPHLAQIDAVLRRFRDVCRGESAQLGSWREDRLAPDEAYDRVWEQADHLVQWLNRMMQQ